MNILADFEVVASGYISRTNETNQMMLMRLQAKCCDESRYAFWRGSDKITMVMAVDFCFEVCNGAIVGFSPFGGCCTGQPATFRLAIAFSTLR